MSKEMVADGWIEWDGGECPVEPETVVDYICRDETPDNYEADPQPARHLDWDHEGAAYDIIAYRVVQP